MSARTLRASTLALVASLRAEIGSGGLATIGERAQLVALGSQQDALLAVADTAREIAALGRLSDAFDRLGQVLTGIPQASPEAVVISGSPPSTATVGQPYSFTPTITGGRTPRLFSLAGTLPAGLVFTTATGAVTGVLTAVEERSGLVITVVDPSGTSSLAPFQIAVSPAVVVTPTNTVRPSISGPLTAGQTVTLSNGSWSGAPTGFVRQLEFSTDGVTGWAPLAGATGTSAVLSGLAGKYLRLGVTATNGAGPNGAFSLVVGPVAAVLAISGTPVTSATQSIPYPGFVVTASGGHGPYTYSVAAGALPAGMALNSTTGAVAGTPAGSGTSLGLVLRATDADGLSANLPSFDLAVSPLGGLEAPAGRGFVIDNPAHGAQLVDRSGVRLTFKL